MAGYKKVEMRAINTRAAALLKEAKPDAAAVERAMDNYDAELVKARANGDEYLTKIDRLHDYAKSIMVAATGVVETAEEKRPEPKILKGMRKLLNDRATDLTKKQSEMEQEGKLLMDAMLDYRDNTWKNNYAGLDPKRAKPHEAQRLKSIAENNKAKDRVTRVSKEYQDRMKLLFKRLADVEAGAVQAFDVSQDLQTLADEIDKAIGSIQGKLSNSLSDQRKKGIKKILAAKNHAKAVVVDKNYETIMPQTINGLARPLKNGKGEMKTLGLRLKRIEKNMGSLPKSTNTKEFKRQHDKAAKKLQECTAELSEATKLMEQLAKKLQALEASK